MGNTLYNISQVLGITIIHSVWQGLLIYFMLRIALLFSARLTSSAKYLLAVSSLLAITIWFVYTLINEIYFYNWLAEEKQTLAIVAMAPHIIQGHDMISDQGMRYYYSIERYLPWVTALYISGLLFNTVKLLVDRRKIGIIRHTMSIEIALQRKVNLFTGMLDIEHRVKVGLTKLVDVPCMVGYLKPVILLPLTLSTYLGAEEIEAILLHELAHIKRNDYLVNLLQQVITTLLFFNPCAQLINRIINDERENCCDDLVVQSASNPVVYAKALLKLEQTRENNMRMAMSATGKKYHLLNRIERIMKTKESKINLYHPLIALLLLVGSIGSIAWLNPKINIKKSAEKTNVPTLAVITAKLANLNNFTRTPDKKLLHRRFTLVSDSNKFKAIADTLKHKKIKIIVEDEQGNKKEYNSVDQLPASDKKEFLDQNYYPDTAFASINKYYASPEWKKQMEDMSKQFNSPQWRKQLQEMAQQSAKLSTQLNNPEWKKQAADMKKMGEDMNRQFNSPEWKKQMEDMNRDMKKQFDNPEWKEQMRKMGEDIKKQFNSPEWKKKQAAEMKKMGEDMRKQFNSPAWKKQMEDMKKQFKMDKKTFKFKYSDSLDMPKVPELPAVPELPEPPKAPENL